MVAKPSLLIDWMFFLAHDVCYPVLILMGIILIDSFCCSPASWKPVVSMMVATAVKVDLDS